VACKGLPEQFKNKKLIFVEGKDDQGFIVGLLDFIGVKDYFVHAIQGKDNFNTDLPDFQDRPGFDKITHLAVIRDQNSDDAYESIKNILVNKMNYPLDFIPDKAGCFAGGKPKIGIFIMPGKKINGTMLEDLCLKIVENKPEMRCVDEYATCVARLKTQKKDMAKAKILAYLAAQNETVNSISLAASKGLWDYDSPWLAELKGFLENLK